MSQTKPLTKADIEAMLPDYKPEILEYDPEVDGSDTYKTRHHHLKEKEALMETITKQQKKTRENRQIRR